MNLTIRVSEPGWIAFKTVCLQKGMDVMDAVPLLARRAVDQPWLLDGR